MKPTTLKGKLTIGRVSQTYGEDYLEISVQDERSHIQVIEIRVAPKEFAEAITGLGYRDCEFEVGNSSLIGKTRETKTEHIQLSLGERENWRQWVAEKVQPLEVDGWESFRLEEFNWHEFDHAKGTYKVFFQRFV